VRRFLFLVVTGLALCGCSIGAQQSAHIIDPKIVPSGLDASASTSPPVTSDVPTENVTLYLELGHDLVAVDRAAPAPVTLRSVLRVLTRSPTRSEQAKGMLNPLSTAQPIILRSFTNDTAVVDLPSNFTDLGGQDQIVAAAQLVYTVTAFPGVDQVSVLVNGESASVPTASGSLSEGPLVRADYVALAPR
jgi:spore germination protein GerM